MSYISKVLPQLKALRLSGLMENLDIRIQQSVEQRLSHGEFLALVLQDECDRRANCKLAQRIKRANFKVNRSLEEFNFNRAGLVVNTSQIFELATCRFIEEKCNVLMVGPTGTGKSHLAEAIGQKACLKGYDVEAYDFSRAMASLRAGHGDGTYQKRLQALVKPDCLILDDFGLKPMTNGADEDFHELVTERHKRGSILLTSNLEFEEWGIPFPNQVLAVASIDRLREDAHRVILDGPSSRTPRPIPGRVKEKSNKSRD